jgi:hypothetical protein
MASALSKAITLVPLTVAAYYVVRCPCDELVKCHRNEFNLALVAAFFLPLLFP